MNKRQTEVLAKFFSEGIPSDDKDRANVEALSQEWENVFHNQHHEKNIPYYDAQVRANIAVLNLIKVRPLIENPDKGNLNAIKASKFYDKYIDVIGTANQSPDYPGFNWTMCRMACKTRHGFSERDFMKFVAIHFETTVKEIKRIRR